MPGLTAIGIDIGGSGVKGARVDVETGAFVGERRREATPGTSTPDAVTGVVAFVASGLVVRSPIGVTFPGVVRGGVIETAANLDGSWIGVDAATLFARRLGQPVVVLNDADAAGIAEMRFGAGRGRGGVVMMLTLGTGIGSALFVDGRLVPNTEFGHIVVAGKDGEKVAAASVRATRRLSWRAWSRRLNRYLGRLEGLVSPDLIILGGGISKHQARFMPYLHTRAELLTAQLFNDAGIVGAALASVALESGPEAGQARL